MTYWTLTEPDLDRIAIGVGILGTGGGGSPYQQMLIAKALLRQGKRIRMVRPVDLPPDAQIIGLGGIGAPTVSIEKMEEGEEGVRVLRAIEAHTGRKVDAVLGDEVGGGNGIYPMITAAKLDLPVVDADGMGRAFPEVQMTSFFVYGQESQPAGLSDAEGNTLVITQASTPEMLEKIMRAATVAMGCTACMTTAPMTGDFVRRFGIAHTTSQAWTLGDAVLRARSDKRDPIAAILAEAGGSPLMRGKVTDIERRIGGGFVRGRLTVAGLDADAGRRITIDIQNEYLVATEGEKRLVMVPDLICIVDAETGRPIGTEEQRYGLRVAVLAIPAPPLLRTPESLRSMGPRAFGYDFDFAPFGQSAEARPVAAYTAAATTASTPLVHSGELQ
ncbi:MAG: DUF917 domain-containing protein [Rhodobacterales bacterium]|nr:DUF917 domain-containing protein [Rhodobacterales bacterium]